MFSTFTNRISQALSVVMHPLMIPTVIFYLLAQFRPDMIFPFNIQNWQYLILFIFLSTYVLPVIAILMLYYFKIVASIMLDTQQDRSKALGAVILIYLITLYMSYDQLSMSKQAVIILACITITLIIAMVITLFWKVSLHSMGMAGLTIFCGAIAQTNDDISVFQIFIGSIIAGGFLLSARLYLNKHDISQIAAGYGLGGMIAIITAVMLL